MVAVGVGEDDALDIERMSADLGQTGHDPLVREEHAGVDQREGTVIFGEDERVDVVARGWYPPDVLTEGDYTSHD